MKKLVHTTELTREEWLEYRRRGIGGSDVSALVGLNPYKSAFEVYLDKRGMLEDKPDNEAMRQGRDLEEYVARRFTEETGLAVHRMNYIISDDEHEYMLANVDRVIRGKAEGLECKTMNPRSRYVADLEENDVPPSYYCQCQWYMAITGWEKWHLAILVLGQGFYRFEIPRNEDDIAILRRETERFWNENVQKAAPPAPDGSASCGDAIKGVYPRSDGREIALDVLKTELLHLQELETAVKENKREIDCIKQNIALSLGDAETGIGNGFRVTMKSQIRRTFDYQQFAKEHPDMELDDYMKPSVSRPFRYKIFEED